MDTESLNPNGFFFIRKQISCWTLHCVKNYDQELINSQSYIPSSTWPRKNLGQTKNLIALSVGYYGYLLLKIYAFVYGTHKHKCTYVTIQVCYNI